MNARRDRAAEISLHFNDPSHALSVNQILAQQFLRDRDRVPIVKRTRQLSHDGTITEVARFGETLAGRPVKFVRMSSRRVIVVGGGAAGFFAAITCAEADPGAEVTVLERGPQFLAKVRISGGGRCNVTHAGGVARDFATRYPRGGKALVGPFHQFSAQDTAAWFESRGVKLKTEADGRMFPVSDSSQTIMDCLTNAARAAGVKLRLNCGVERVVKRDQGGFEVALATERRTPIPRVGVQALACSGSTLKRELQLEPGAPIKTLCRDRLLLATGGCRAAVAGQLAVSLGHTLEPPVPSLFTFRIESPWLRSLAGISLELVEGRALSANCANADRLLVTHGA